MGPVDLTVGAGETVFIVGGNGSGKSTLLRVLTWLYEPKTGAILWDGQLVDRSNVADYRNLFSTVFSDFHLFDRLYGLPGVDPAEAEALLRTMGIAGKTQFRDGGFTNLDLSTGQRKRLAFVAALLEDKPIYVLDELAADQDGEFRRAFYEQHLPSLKARGKTLVVVSHDERYFHVADRVLVMEDGRFVEGGWSR
jgi:putative ATP-binding cassette transporter